MIRTIAESFFHGNQDTGVRCRRSRQLEISEIVMDADRPVNRVGLCSVQFSRERGAHRCPPVARTKLIGTRRPCDPPRLQARHQIDCW